MPVGQIQFGMMTRSHSESDMDHVSLAPTCICTVLVTDLDRTLIASDSDEKSVEREDNLQDIADFYKEWEQLVVDGKYLIYATGRSFNGYGQAKMTFNLRHPDVLICHDGVQVYRQDSRNGLVADQKWLHCLDEDWDQDEMQEIYRDCSKHFAKWVVTPNANQSGNVEQYRFNILVRVDEENKTDVLEDMCSFIKKEVQRRNEASAEKDKKLRVHVCCCVASQNNEWWISFMPQGAGKGNALKYVLTTLQNSDPRVVCDPVIVCGDSGNDISMMKVDGIDNIKAVVVNNGGEDIKRFVRQNVESHNRLIADGDRTRGVIKGLLHFARRQDQNEQQEEKEENEPQLQPRGMARSVTC